jgi:DNA polymerase-3 subunit alpha
VKPPLPLPVAFVPLHNHSDYSLLDGASQLPAMVERAVELGMPALALTDHGVMYGAIELLKLCSKAGLKPIIGNEMYVINGSLDDPNPPKKERRYHLVVLAKNAVGYRNLVKLTSISHLRGMRGRASTRPPSRSTARG